MKEFKMKPGLGLFISLAFIFALDVTTSVAQQKFKFAGKLTYASIKQEMMNFGDTEDHNISLAELEGTNVSTGRHEFMDGAQTAIVLFSDYVKGSGLHHGYLKLSLNGDAVFSKFEGKSCFSWTCY